MHSREKYTREQIIKALVDNKGMVYLAAEALGCSHVTVYNYIERHPTVKAAWQAVNGRVGDKTELKLFDAIERGESWAVAFYLKTKGKDRGYVERQEVSGADGGPVVITTIEVIKPDGS